MNLITQTFFFQSFRIEFCEGRLCEVKAKAVNTPFCETRDVETCSPCQWETCPVVMTDETSKCAYVDCNSEFSPITNDPEPKTKVWLNYVFIGNHF